MCYRDQEGATGQFNFDGRSPVFTDGSAVWGSDERMATAAFAAVQMLSLDPLRWRAVTGSVPSYCEQSAAAAERYAVVCAAICTAPGHTIEVVSDCLSAVMEAKDARRAAGFDRPWGGLWRQLPDGVLKGIQHVHSHRSVDEAQGELRELRRGNAVADALAIARSASDAPNGLVSRAVQAEAAQLRGYAVALAKRLACWRPLRRAAAQAKTRGLRRREAVMPPTHRHEFQRVRAEWRCMQCCCVAKEERPVQIPRE